MANSNPAVAIYTDGACELNPGPGGWAALLVSGGARCAPSGGFRRTTNNRMELVAVIEGLRGLGRQAHAGDDPSCEALGAEVFRGRRRGKSTINREDQEAALASIGRQRQCGRDGERARLHGALGCGAGNR